MEKKIGHEYIKQVVADRLSSAEGPAMAVLTEVGISEGGKEIARADIVMFRNEIRPEITIIEIKLKAGEIVTRNQKIDRNILQLMKVYWGYANQTYLCLPKKECTTLVTSLCRHKNIGLIAVNIDPDDGPKGYLIRIVSPIWNKEPKKWIELGLRLEKLGIHPIYFA